jgi:hypothetical protein
LGQPEVDDIAEQLRRRDQHRKRLAAQMTPEQRLERMAQMQAYSWQLLQQNPEALDRFWRRNLRQRAARLDARGTP